MGNDSFWTTVLIIGVLAGIFLLGVIMGSAGAPFDNINGTTGIPVTDVQMSEDGTSITYNIGLTQMSVTLDNPESRPPNLSTSTSIIVTDEQIIFINSEGAKIFEGPLDYQAIFVLEG